MKSMSKMRDKRLAVNTLYLCIAAAILTADDLWGINQEKTDEYVKAFGEVLNGYGDEGEIQFLQRELEDRGIRIRLGDDYISKPTEKKYERGKGAWIEHKSGKGRYFTCSHCGTKTIIKRKYCSVCGAMNKREGEC